MKKTRTPLGIIMLMGLIAITFSLTSCGSFREITSNKKNSITEVENSSTSNFYQSTNTVGNETARPETEKYAVTAAHLYVRKSASAEAAKLGALSKGDHIDVYGFKGNWAEIRFKGEKAFVGKSFIEKVGDDMVEDTSSGSDSNLYISPSLTHKDSSNNKEEMTLQIESDGFQWYKIIKEGKVGVQSPNGETLIPLSNNYDYICYSTSLKGGGWFCVGRNGKRGCCNKEGREIVAPNKYDSLTYEVSYRTRRNKTGAEYCFVYLNGKKGVCDRDGQEIIPPDFDPEELLCFWDFWGVGCGDQFMYKKNGQWRETNVCLSKKGKGRGWFRRDDDGKKEQLRAEWGEIVGGAVTSVLSSTLQQSTTPDNTVNKSSPSIYSDNDDYEDDNPAPKKPKKPKKCGACNGRGWNVKYVAGFGLAEKEYCSQCGKEMMSNHYHATCTRCDGKGYK